jgi:hypothetical protein
VDTGRETTLRPVAENAGAADAHTKGGTTATVTRDRVKHSERLYVPWWGWPLPILGGVLLAAEIHMGYPGVRAWLPYLIMIPLVAALLLSLGKSRVRVLEDDDGERELEVGDARLPLRFAGEVEVIARKDKRKALGPELDPAAFVLHRGWVGPVVRMRLTDPDDPTPYWVFSTRRPEALVKLLRA